VPLVAAAAGFLLLTAHPREMPVLMGFFLMAATGTAYMSVFWAMPSEILSPTIAATGVGLINAVGSIAGFAAPYAFGYLHTATGSLNPGLVLTALCSFGAGMLILCAPRG